MNLSSKKHFIYTLTILAILGIAGFLVYRYMLPALTVRPSPAGQPVTGRIPPPARPGVPPTPEEPGAAPVKIPPSEIGAEEQLLQITDFPVVSPSFNKAGDKILFYKKDGGDLYSAKTDGRTLEKISNLTVIGLFDALWSPERDRAVVRYLDQETIKAFLHVGTSTARALPSDIAALAWSPSGASLAYLVPEELRARLISIDRAGAQTKTIAEVPLRDAAINWITDDKIAFETRPSGLAEGFVFTFSRKGGNFTRILGPLFGLATLWSPDGSKILTSRTARGGTQLQLVVTDAAGRGIWQTKLGTLPEKCAWLDSQEFYCAAPSQILPSQLWPDDYLRGEIVSTDHLILARADTQRILDIALNGSFDVSAPLISKDKKYLFFVNRKDGTLWRLKLNP